MAAGITIDKTDLLSVESSMKAIKAGAPDAIRFATNNTLSTTKTATSKEIRNHVTAKATAVNKTLTIKKMFKSDMSANITCTGKPLPLISYQVSQVVRGVNVKVLVSGSKKLVEHAFIATMKSSHKGVFWRTDTRRGTSKRFPVGKRTAIPPPRARSGYEIAHGIGNFQLPIHELYGPRVPDVLTKESVMTPILLEAAQYLEKRLDYHIDQLLEKAKAA
jgi:hypothetical protein